MTDMEEEKTLESGDQQPQEKQFTQEDVNRIVGERLKKDRKDREQEFEEREKALLQKELRYEAKDLLTEKKIPEGYLELLDYSSKDACMESIEKVEKVYNSSKPTVTLRGAEPCNPPQSHPSTDMIRKGFGL